MLLDALGQPRFVSSKSSAILASNATATRFNVSIRTSSLLDSSSLINAWRRPAALASCSCVILCARRSRRKLRAKMCRAA
jgi:hypothetical protein